MDIATVKSTSPPRNAENPTIPDATLIVQMRHERVEPRCFLPRPVLLLGLSPSRPTLTHPPFASVPADCPRIPMLLVRTLDSGLWTLDSGPRPRTPDSPLSRETVVTDGADRAHRVTAGRPSERLHKLLDAANLPPKKTRTGLKSSPLLLLTCGAVVRSPTHVDRAG